MKEHPTAGAPETYLDSGVPIESAGPASAVAERVRQGKAFLKVVEMPWGVEFYIVERVGEA